MPDQEIFASLSEPMRRDIIRKLHRADGVVTVEDLCDTEEDQIALQHIHAPKLSEMDVIEMDSGGLRPGDRFDDVYEALEAVEHTVHGQEVT